MGSMRPSMDTYHARSIFNNQKIGGYMSPQRSPRPCLRWVHRVCVCVDPESSSSASSSSDDDDEIAGLDAEFFFLSLIHI